MKKSFATWKDSFLAKDELDPWCAWRWRIISLRRFTRSRMEMDAPVAFSTSSISRTRACSAFPCPIRQGRHLIQHKVEYYSLLRGVTESADWEDWLLFFTQGRRGNRQNGRPAELSLSAICSIDARPLSRQACRPKFIPRNSIELIFTQPYCKIQFLGGGGNRRSGRLLGIPPRAGEIWCSHRRKARA